MIDSYGLMAISMACFYTFVLKQNYTRQIVFFFSFLLIGLNQFQTFQRRRTLIHWDSMTKDAYWDVFLKRGLTEEELEQHNERLSPPNYSKAKKGEKEYDFNPF